MQNTIDVHYKGVFLYQKYRFALQTWVFTTKNIIDVYHKRYILHQKTPTKHIVLRLSTTIITFQKISCLEESKQRKDGSFFRKKTFLFILDISNLIHDISKTMFRKNKKQPTTGTDLVNTLTSSPIKAFFKEISLFVGIFVTVFVVSVAFVNANLLYHTVKDFFIGVQAAEYNFDMGTKVEQTNLIAQLWDETGGETKQVLKTTSISAQSARESSLQAKTYPFSYSMVPPEHRLFIPSLGIDAPIVDVSAATEDKLKRGDFTTELNSGVVKYPSTANPGTYGNSLIFGHTSYYRWKNNPYGEVFAKIYDLKNGDTIKVAWWGQLYTYEVIDKVIVLPEKVDEIYDQYTEGEFITLMGCYPIWSDAKRVLIIAKRIQDKQVSAVQVQ